MTTFVNIPPMIGSVVNSRLATLHELDTVYGLEGLYDLYEVLVIRTANEQKIMNRAKKGIKK